MAENNTRAWVAVLTKGSASLKKKLTAKHGDKPEFQRLLKSTGQDKETWYKMHQKKQARLRGEDPVSKERTLTTPKESYKIGLKKENIDVITNAMLDVNRFGTSAAAFKGASYNAAGKTGTAQVFSLNSKTYSHSSTPEFLRDHALYIVFAPAEKPKIAIAMVVENAGFGAAQAAPIARKALDYYIEGRWPKEIPEWKNAP